jgi:PilZ domain
VNLVGTNPALDEAGERRSDIARREAARVARRIPATVTLADGDAIGCTINDVSETGAGIACLTAIMPGTPLMIALPGIGAVAADVAWVSGVRIGIAFHARIDPAAVIVPPLPVASIDRRKKAAQPSR